MDPDGVLPDAIPHDGASHGGVPGPADGAAGADQTEFVPMATDIPRAASTPPPPRRRRGPRPTKAATRRRGRDDPRRDPFAPGPARAGTRFEEGGPRRTSCSPAPSPTASRPPRRGPWSLCPRMTRHPAPSRTARRCGSRVSPVRSSASRPRRPHVPRGRFGSPVGRARPRPHAMPASPGRADRLPRAQISSRGPGLRARRPERPRNGVQEGKSSSSAFRSVWRGSRTSRERRCAATRPSAGHSSGGPPPKENPDPSPRAGRCAPVRDLPGMRGRTRGSSTARTSRASALSGPHRHHVGDHLPWRGPTPRPFTSVI